MPSGRDIFDRSLYGKGCYSDHVVLRVSYEVYDDGNGRMEVAGDEAIWSLARCPLLYTIHCLLLINTLVYCHLYLGHLIFVFYSISILISCIQLIMPFLKRNSSQKLAYARKI
jgi:hypothetical protein